jgi:hypothetical protein
MGTDADRGRFASAKPNNMDEWRGRLVPAQLTRLSKAFEEACNALQVFAGDEKGREIIVNRIIDLARTGLIDSTDIT